MSVQWTGPVIPVCRYGQTWADWREVGDTGGDRTERLTLEEGEGVTALTGQSHDSTGRTYNLDVTTSSGRRWQQGLQREEGVFSLRPSSALGGASLLGPEGGSHSQ